MFGQEGFDGDVDGGALLAGEAAVLASGDGDELVVDAGLGERCR